MIDHIFFDARFSAKDSNNGEMIDIAAIRTDGTGKPIDGAAYSSKITPLGTVDRDSYKLNGYNETDWEESVPKESAIAMLRSIILSKKFDEKYIVVSHVTERFQHPMRAAVFPGRAWIDTSQVAWPLVEGGLVSDRSLIALTRYFNQPLDMNLSTAEGNAASIARVYWAMLRRFKTAVRGESMIQKVVEGTQFDSLRKLVGL